MVSAGITSPVVSSRPFFGNGLAEARPAEGGADGLGRFAFLAKGERFLDIDQGDFFRPQPMRFGGGITADVSGPDDHDLLPHLDLIELALTEEVQGRDHFFLAGNGQNAGFLSAHGDHDKIEIRLDLFEIVRTQFLLQEDVGKRVLHPLQLSVHHLIGNAAPGE